MSTSAPDDTGVAFVSPFSSAAASSRRMIELARGFRDATCLFAARDRYGETSDRHGVRISVPKSSAVRYLATAFRRLRELRPRVVVCLKPHPYTLLPAIGAQLSWGARLVCDFDEWEPATLRDNDAPPWHRGVARLMIWLACLRTDGIIVANRKITGRLPGWYEGPVEYVPNGVRPSDYRDASEDRELAAGGPNRITITYVGSLHKSEQIEPILHAVPRMDERLDDYRLVFVGPGNRDELRRAVPSANVEFLGAVPHERIPGLLAASDILLAVFGALESLEYASNMKLFEYMAAEKPIVATAVGEIPEILEEGRAGYLVPADDGAALTDVVEEIVRAPGRAREKARRAGELAATEYCWSHLSERLERFCDAVSGTGAPNRAGREA